MIQTNWIVLTGGPSTGKTTLVEELKRRGYFVVPESARAQIDECLAQGQTLEQIRRDEKVFQDIVLKKKVEMEKTLDPSQTIFLDRGFHDSKGYYNFIKMKFSEEQFNDHPFRYKHVFILNLLPYQKDNIRTESAEDQKVLHDYIHQAYKDADYNLIEVPALPVDERIEYIFANILP